MSVDSPPIPRSMSESEQRGFVVFATWIIAGLFLDGWSHQVNKPEDFFTPWHALMYSGFGAAVLFGIAIGRREDGEAVNDKLTALGVVLFAVGMVGDLGWHSLFGVEANVEALLSPTHLLLMAGGLLLASMPARSAMRDAVAAGVRRPTASFATVWSVTGTIAVVAFFLQFAMAFRGRDAANYVYLSGVDGFAEVNIIRGVMAILLTNLLLAGAATFVAANWKTRPGQLTLLLSAVAIGVSGLDSFRHVELVFAAVLAGAAADLVVARKRPDMVPVAISVVLWPLWFGLLATTATFGWSQNSWGGAIFLAILSGFGLKVLATRSFRDL